MGKAVLLQVIQKAREVWKDDGSRSALLERVDFVEGDFFKHGGQHCHPQHYPKRLLAQFCTQLIHPLATLLYWPQCAKESLIIPWVQGSFLAAQHALCAAETIPAGKDGDVYVLRLILHDWMDADSVVILSNIRAAIGAAKARVVIAEVLPAVPYNG